MKTAVLKLSKNTSFKKTLSRLNRFTRESSLIKKLNERGTYKVGAPFLAGNARKLLYTPKSHFHNNLDVLCKKTEEF